MLACPTLSKMRPMGLGGHRMLSPMLSVFLLVLLLLGPSQPLTGIQTKSGIFGVSTAPSTPRALIKPDSTSSTSTTAGNSNFPDVRDRARALMQDFPLVDGYVKDGLGLKPG